MKALSLTQPWATAICLGLKKWETRSWATGIRGEVAIHAAKGFPGWAKHVASEARFRWGIPEQRDIPLGAIVAVAELVDCRKTETLQDTLEACELYFGDYSDGRFAYKFENVRVLHTPVKAKGALGFWMVGPDEAWQVSNQFCEPAGIVACHERTGS